MKIIAHIRTDFKEKFGIPRQSGLVPETMGVIIFEKEYRAAEAVRGLEEFSHIWLLWEFSKSRRDVWSPTVRPPLLGGNKRMGVFATRSPFRPNPIGLSCVKLEEVRYAESYGPILVVSGVDILDGTPVYDIKPYLPYADSHPEATEGFTERFHERKLEIKIHCKEFFGLPKNKQREITDILSFNPTPAYKGDGKIYGMKYSDYEIKFRIEGKILYITQINSIINT